MDRSASPSVDVKDSEKRIHPDRVIAGIIVAWIAFVIIRFVIVTEQFAWPVVYEYLFDSKILKGVGVTIGMALLAHTIGTVLGVIFAVARMSSFAPVRWVSIAYVTLFRSIPALVQLLFWFNIAYLIPELTLSLPFGLFEETWDTNRVVTPAIAAIIGLSLPQGAYMSEILRGSILSVPSGQQDAARALGYSPYRTFMKITLPQAVRVAIPPTGGQFIHIIHATALVSVIAVSDLLFSVQNVYQKTYQIVPLLLVAVIWYVALTLILTYFQGKLEKYFGKGYADQRANEASTKGEADE